MRQGENRQNLRQDSSFGGRLRKARTEKSLSQTELAEILGYKGDASVSNLETGRSSSVPIAVLANLADVLEVDLHWLITGQGSPEVVRQVDTYGRALKRLLPYVQAYGNVLEQLQDIVQRGPDYLREPGSGFAFQVKPMLGRVDRLAMWSVQVDQAIADIAPLAYSRPAMPPGSGGSELGPSDPRNPPPPDETE